MSNRTECTEENPYKKGAEGQWYHPKAKEGSQEDGWPSGDIVTWECPVCGVRWKEELPQ